MSKKQSPASSSAISSSRYYGRFALYIAVIALAFTLPSPMNVIQAAVGGMALGAKLVLFAAERTKP